VIFIVDITYGWSLSLSVSFGKRTYRGIHESQALSVVGAKSCRLVNQPYDVLCWTYMFSFLIFTGPTSFLQQIFCHSFVERKWLYNNVCSRLDF
jgi:hypothetical protein